ncbi:UPF0182 family protein [Corynebacterium aquilae]|uniref:UPF0182 protein CAQU_03075 n=1 Tax=Corynebacterium aquilae DSM 44791 TaxID=1431546 RepID=A0A1L7CEF0_9CORY|nr:UPF0182 family protein [Corynebacterium aquilae]APT84221.1 hypothetical protein CAQU_03075 [Corynebacterium aquilae DSM 44791]
MAASLKRPRSAKKPTSWVAWIIVIFSILATILPIIIGMSTDWLWFKEVDYTRVFSTVLLARLSLFLGVGLFSALVVWVAIITVYNTRPMDLPELDPEHPVAMSRQVVDNFRKTLFVVLPLVMGLVLGTVAQTNWSTVLLFFNRTSFGKSDPQFGYDYGFYAFTLPLLQLIVGILSMLLIVAFLLGLIGHYLTGGIRIGNRLAGVSGFVSKAARTQLAITAGLWVLVKVAGYWLDRFALLTNNHASFMGGSYRDINATLPAKTIMMVIGVLVALAFFTAVVFKDLRIPALGTVLMLIASILIGQAWPLAVEQFSVAPNRQAKEAEYIGRNIEATRYAFGLTDANVTYEKNWGADGASDEAVASDAATLSNIRLLDPKILSKTFTQQQQLKNFYGFPETLNMDRYTVDGELRDYVVAARELNPKDLSGNQTDWINRHTVYTHGNGYVAAQANKVDEVAKDVGSTRGGYPVYTVADLQTLQRQKDNPEAEKIGIEVTEPRVYFGPVIAGDNPNLDYAVVGNNGGEPVEYDTDTSTYTYQGRGGVPIGNPVSRALFAARYQEMNLLLSDRIGSESKIIFQRDPRTRVKKVAPWLTADSATYPAVIDGRIKWIVDGYTTLDNLPYSQRTSLTDATADSRGAGMNSALLVSQQVGYIRNSVKAVVDAYDGTVDLYEFDDKDPVLKAWEGVFPGSVKPKSEISEELRKHLRYPEDMFKVQRELIAKYHVDDPRTFFTGDAFWSVPKDPTSQDERRETNQPPYYVVAADPKTKQPSFQLISPFRGLEREYLAAHMTVNSDPDNYGHITVRVLPTNTQTQGPKQAQDIMMSSDNIARDQTLWKNTNTLRYGNLLTLPVGGGEILYVEPMYTERKGQASAFPKLLRVLVSYKGRVGYASTSAEALSQVGIDPREANDLEEAIASGATQLGDKREVDENKDDASKKEGGETSLPAGQLPSGDGVERINRAIDALRDAKGKSFEEYGRAIDQLDAAVQDYQRSQGQQPAADLPKP